MTEGTPAQSAWRAALPTILVVALFVFYCLFVIHGRASADLTALWLAGEFLANGRPDLVYPDDTRIFTMLPPPEWFAKARNGDAPGDVFPYLYPPLWAALSAVLTRITSLATVLSVASVLNPLLLAGCLVLAARIARSALPTASFVLIGAVLFASTTIGVVAIGQGQPQIAVSVLVLLAIERSERGAPVAAGIALALAAALKVYPALFVIVWIVGGQRKAVLAFLSAGGALALLSLGVAGWPLHAEFLRLLAVVSRTAMATNFTYGIDGLLSHLVLADRAEFILSPGRDPALGARAGWYVALKPAAVAAALLLAQVAVLGAAGIGLRRVAEPIRRAAIWAAALTFATFLGPVAWAYYFIIPAAFLPLLVARLGSSAGLVSLAAVGALASAYVSLAAILLPDPGRAIYFTGPIAVVLMGALFLLASRHPQRPAA